METFFFKPELYNRLYNCTSYDIDQIPLEQRKHFLVGALYMVFGIISEILYLPCLISLWKHMDNTCYKFMFFIGITDLLMIPISSIITGYLAITGAVFCTAPTFIYFCGACALGLTVAENTAQIFLALNRCIELVSYGNSARVLFHGKRIYLWMIFCIIYGMYFFIFTMPIIFSSVIGTWFINPHFAYNDDLSGTIYRSDLATIHNYMVVVVLTGTYLVFTIVLLTKMGFKCQANANNNTNSQTSSISQKRIFVQVFLISSVNDAAATICALMNFLPVGNTLITLGQITWMLSFGIPPFIYLLLNKTIRQEVIGILRKLCIKLVPKIISKKIGPKTQIAIAVVKVGPAENVKKMNNPLARND
ncbi:hypothetical protein niasHT_011470 [Heterodera trifolii]|uniref:Odorant receptor n=1 Tax=Heterodera trifolii TaxID=157864 RepID=A0ABD2L118_9BILA